MDIERAQRASQQPITQLIDIDLSSSVDALLQLSQSPEQLSSPWPCEDTLDTWISPPATSDVLMSSHAPPYGAAAPRPPPHLSSHAYPSTSYHRQADDYLRSPNARAVSESSNANDCAQTRHKTTANCDDLMKFTDSGNSSSSIGGTKREVENCCGPISTSSPLKTDSTDMLNGTNPPPNAKRGCFAYPAVDTSGDVLSALLSPLPPPPLPALGLTPVAQLPPDLVPVVIPPVPLDQPFPPPPPLPKPLENLPPPLAVSSMESLTDTAEGEVSIDVSRRKTATIYQPPFRGSRYEGASPAFFKRSNEEKEAAQLVGFTPDRKRHATAESSSSRSVPGDNCHLTSTSNVPRRPIGFGERKATPTTSKRTSGAFTINQIENSPSSQIDGSKIGSQAAVKKEPSVGSSSSATKKPVFPPPTKGGGWSRFSNEGGRSPKQDTDAPMADTDFMRKYGDKFSWATESDWAGEGYIDTHCHLDFLFKKQSHGSGIVEFRNKMKTTWSNAFHGCIPDWCEPEQLRRSDMNDPTCWINLMKEKDIVKGVAFGCHPHYSNKFDDALHGVLSERLRLPECIAVGECGLDYSHKNNLSKKIQAHAYESQLCFAKELHKPLVIHCRDSDNESASRSGAEEDCRRLTKQGLDKYHKIHRHCFTLGMEDATPWLKEFPNLYFGLTPLIVEPAGSRRKVLEAAKNVPLDRLLIETDAPFFLPHFYQKKQFGGLKHSHPGVAINVALQIAELRDERVEQVLAQIRENTRIVYGV